MVREMNDLALIERVLRGDDSPEWEAAEEELSIRAFTGNFRCQCASLNILAEMWRQGVIETGDWTGRAEPLARLTAKKGGPDEGMRLAALLHAKAENLKREHRDSAAYTAYVECLSILDRLADAGVDEALGLLSQYAATAPEDAVRAAKAIGLASRPSSPPPPATEQVEWAPTEDTRIERCRFWLSDRAWDLRLMWWRVIDIFAALRPWRTY
jgi:hypothetical protein